MLTEVHLQRGRVAACLTISDPVGWGYECKGRSVGDTQSASKRREVDEQVIHFSNSLCVMMVHRCPSAMSCAVERALLAKYKASEDKIAHSEGQSDV